MDIPTIHLLVLDHGEYDDSTPDWRVVGAFLTENEARAALAELVLHPSLGMPYPVRGARIEQVELRGQQAGPPTEHEPESVGDLAARADQHERRQMATALDPRHVGADAPSWSTLRNAVRDLRRGPAGDGPRFVQALRDALAPAVTGSVTVDELDRTALLDVVRSVVEAANTPGAVHRERLGELDPALTVNAERLESAAMSAAGLTPASWASADGRVQERYVQEAQGVVEAYLADPEDG